MESRKGEVSEEWSKFKNWNEVYKKVYKMKEKEFEFQKQRMKEFEEADHKQKQEFKSLSEKIRELDLKIMNDEISLLVFLNLRNDLDKEFIKRLKKELIYSIGADFVANNQFNPNIINEEIDKLAGDKLTKSKY